LMVKNIAEVAQG